MDSSTFEIRHVQFCKQKCQYTIKNRVVNLVDPDEMALYRLQRYLSWSTKMKKLLLTLKAQSKFVADNILYLILLLFRENVLTFQMLGRQFT